MNLGSLKQKKWGLPLYVWAGITALAIIAIYMIVKRRGNSSTFTNATPNDANVTDLPNMLDGTGSGGGGLGIPDSPHIGADENVGTVIPQTDPTNTTTPVTVNTINAPQPGDTVSPAPVVTTSSKATQPVSANVLVPVNATATSLQSSVMKTGPSAVFVPGTPTRAAQLQHPAAVKVTANKTGASANKAQGIFAIH